MIFVTVGTHTDGFSRLVQAMDAIAEQGNEEVVMQIGATSYEPRAARWFRFVSQQEIDELCREARVIVSHAGAGSIISALQYGKPLIVMPRLHRYGEHMDDHQTELATALARTGSILVAYETKDLAGALAATTGFAPHRSDPSCLVTAVRQAVMDPRRGG